MKTLTRIDEARTAWREAVERMEQSHTALANAPEDAKPDELEAMEQTFVADEREAARCRDNLDRLERIARAQADVVAHDEERESKQTVEAEQRAERTTRTREPIQVGKEPLVYAKGNRRSFFGDLYAARQGGHQAQERLKRHAIEMAVERRDLSSTDGAGGDFIAPKWMMDDWLTLARAARPTANAVRNLELPAGTDSINMPRLVTGGAVSAQADLGAVQETDPTTGSLAVAVKTIAGQVDVSRQLLDRSTPGIDEILFADLTADYNTKIDMQVLNGSGAGANAKGMLQDTARVQVTYTDATPTVGELYGKLADAVQQIGTNRFLPATGIIMHPRRWGWLLAALDTTNRPLVLPAAQNPSDTPASFGGLGPEGAVGQMFGLPIILDASLPTTLGAGTNEDVIIVSRLEDNYLFEDGAPRTRVYEDVLSANLAVRLQIFGYYAFTSERFSKSNATIGGTGLVAPTF